MATKTNIKRNILLKIPAWEANWEYAAEAKLKVHTQKRILTKFKVEKLPVYHTSYNEPRERGF